MGEHDLLDFCHAGAPRDGGGLQDGASPGNAPPGPGGMRRSKALTLAFAGTHSPLLLARAVAQSFASRSAASGAGLLHREGGAARPEAAASLTGAAAAHRPAAQAPRRRRGTAHAAGGSAGVSAAGETAAPPAREPAAGARSAPGRFHGISGGASSLSARRRAAPRPAAQVPPRQVRRHGRATPMAPPRRAARHRQERTVPPGEGVGGASTAASAPPRRRRRRTHRPQHRFLHRSGGGDASAAAGSPSGRRRSSSAVGCGGAVDCRRGAAPHRPGEIPTAAAEFASPAECGGLFVGHRRLVRGERRRLGGGHCASASASVDLGHMARGQRVVSFVADPPALSSLGGDIGGEHRRRGSRGRASVTGGW